MAVLWRLKGVCAVNALPQDLFKQQAYVGGEWTQAQDGAVLPVCNPADGVLLGSVPALGAAETAAAVASAEAALPAWRGLPAKVRSRLLKRWFDLITARQRDLAWLLTLEQGKPLAEAQSEIAYGASYIEWFAEEAKRVCGDTLPAPVTGQRVLVFKQAVGVCAAVTPWNFPNAMIARKAAPALAAGCTFVVRPASQTPFSALALAELAHQAGIPAGVFNVVTGDADTVGRVLTEHPSVRKFSFTGSTAVGRKLMAQCASTVKKISLELGGNAPFIVFDDADLPAAVAGAVAAKFRNAGQTCICANRIYVQKNIYPAFAEAFTRAVSALRVGKGTDESSHIGPLIDGKALRRTQDLLADARARGGRVLCGGTHEGAFFAPTVLADAHDEMRLAHEEIFAPLAPLFCFDGEAEVLRRANATEYGLAAYVYSRDLARVFRVSEALEYGMVGVNTGVISNEAAPFGGIKQSGIGREGSRYGLDEYLEIKYVAVDGLSAGADAGGACAD
ncbi:NAD-dependent succinate-semialdehyde dehydrogenase [Conchiformibius kuhniae]|uniref:NAD-dependent succinate-semialdehyde dehydrogenase n=1 Tax=Conchiformibius kuhniae TaxID=211502 RepID=A0ABD8B8I9_9NEIS|nr:NAD-dependent succinate-semialdehyde dehydrogenase [Conchiformibius kuhniae]